MSTCWHCGSTKADVMQVMTNDVGDADLANAINQLRLFGVRNNNQNENQMPLSPSNSIPIRPKNQKVEKTKVQKGKQSKRSTYC